MTISETAADLFNYYLSHLALGLTATKRESELAKEFAINHCDRIISYIKDADSVSFWENVKKVLSGY